MVICILKNWMGLETRENEKTPWKEGNRRKERSKDII